MDPMTCSSSSRPVVAAFDVDKTLTTRDCVIPFLRQVGGLAFIGRLAVRSPQFLVAILQRRRDRIKALATRAAVRGRSLVDVDAVAQRFANEVWERRMRSDTTARLRWHVSQGHRVVLVSASYRNYLVPLADRLGAHHVISTELAVADGICTGELRGPNCRGAVKADRLRAWIVDAGLSDVEIHAYGDSAGDRELLAMADRSTLVGTTPLDVVPRVVETSGSS